MTQRRLRHADHFDWDGLQTLMLTGLLLITTASLLLLPSLIRACRIARQTSDCVPGGYDCLVFGKQSINGQVDDEYRQRLTKAIELFRQRPRTLILLGGHTTCGEPSEAEMGLRELQRLGLPDSAPVLLEQQSRHTLDNLRNARELHQDHPVLISSRYHLARCSLIANNLGMNHTLCAAEPELSGGLATHFKLLKEAFFILWFQVGKGWARLTNNQRMLKRIS
jgi:vancomycin permeability regulator SanA